MRRIYLFVSFLTLLSSLQSCKNKQEEQLNVLLITWDGGATRLACYGDTLAYTPQLDSFAQSAFVFDQAYTAISLNNAARHSVYTGLRPGTTHLVKQNDNWRRVLPDYTCLSSYFKQNGYRTIGAGFHYEGFDTLLTQEPVASNQPVFQFLPEFKVGQKPYFMELHYAFLAALLQDSLPVLSVTKEQEVQSRLQHLPDSLKDDYFPYYAKSALLDSLVGNMLNRLQRERLLENTLVLIYAYHGFSLAADSCLPYGYCSPAETRVPFMLRVPNYKAPAKRVPALVELVDLYPTLLECCALPPVEQSLEGISLKPLLEQPTRSWKKAVFSQQAYAHDLLAIQNAEFLLQSFGHDSLALFQKQAPDSLREKDVSSLYPAAFSRFKQFYEDGWQSALPVVKAASPER